MFISLMLINFSQKYSNVYHKGFPSRIFLFRTYLKWSYGGADIKNSVVELL